LFAYRKHLLDEEKKEKEAEKTKKKTGQPSSPFDTDEEEDSDDDEEPIVVSKAASTPPPPVPKKKRSSVEVVNTDRSPKPSKRIRPVEIEVNLFANSLKQRSSILICPKKVSKSTKTIF